MWWSKRKERQEKYDLMCLMLDDAIDARYKAEMDRLNFYERWRDSRIEVHRLQKENARLRSLLDRPSARKHAMMPRSQMARQAKDALDYTEGADADDTQENNSR